MQADVHPHCSLERLEFVKGVIPIEPISLSLSPKISRCDVNDATETPPPTDRMEDCLANGAEAIDIEPLNEDPPFKDVFNDGFRDILSLKESRGLRTASMAGFLTHTLVILLLLLYSEIILGVVVLFLMLDFEISELALTLFEL